MREAGTRGNFTTALVLIFLSSCGGGGGGGPADTGVDGPTDTDVDSQPDSVVDTAIDSPEDDGATDTPEDDGSSGETECGSDGDCDDGDPCTSDSCDVDFGLCGHDPVDSDADGYAASSVGGAACGGNDCDDADAELNPGAAPDCTGTVDRDCDGLDDPDEDSDGHLATACSGDDCDDSDPDAFPGSLALDCGTDRNCNGQGDRDDDGDGHDSEACSGDDCDDADGDVHPGATELNCNGIDDDCNGEMSSFEDADLDGWANEYCVAPGTDADCDDADPAAHPGAPEVCDAVDNDCDGGWQDGGADDDLDGHLDGACGGDDCDDSDPASHPGEAEFCDAADNDCDGSADEADPVLDPTRVTNDFHASQSPSLAWTGSEFGVAWSDDRSGSYQIWFARVSAGGAKIGSDARIMTTSGLGTVPWLTWSGSEYGLVWSDDRLGNQALFFARVSGSGAKVAFETRISDDAATANYPRVLHTGSEYAVAWLDYRDWIDNEVYFNRFSDAGIPVGSDVRVTDTANGPWEVEMAWSGSEFGLAWSNGPSGIKQIWFGRISAQGAVIGSHLEVSDAAEGAWYPSILWTGSEFGLAWWQAEGSYRRVHLARISEAGTILGSGAGVGIMETSGFPPYLGWGEGEFLACTSDGAAQTCTRLSGEGSPISSAIDLSSPGYVPSRLVWNGSVFGQSWHATVDGNLEILFGELDPGMWCP